MSATIFAITSGAVAGIFGGLYWLAFFKARSEIRKVTSDLSEKKLLVPEDDRETILRLIGLRDVSGPLFGVTLLSLTPAYLLFLSDKNKLMGGFSCLVVLLTILAYGFQLQTKEIEDKVKASSSQ